MAAPDDVAVDEGCAGRLRRGWPTTTTAAIAGRPGATYDGAGA